ncbi:ABC-2 type transport system ATP-binding protein [Prosthecobacter debontii]|uniref:ABC-2 type transport system ATP-binding protein n=1 Tax=Prosthecobacter debontii TaxID=48467 RepID=A0A1T4Y0C4_9BACT|nr:ABC transporter ATP-binding protein [Prosthecobacter debontii]SKA95249.1 ABC-2 type transport system ATP-binding protein [Prosthecobacter debontii]
MIQIEKLTMHYGDLKALNDLTLEVRPGELFAFLGPNGAGKTTAIRLLTGMMKPMKGRVEICGIDIQKEPLKAKSLLGYVPDVAAFYEKLTAPEFMQFIAELFEMDVAYAAERTKDLFTQFALHEHCRQRIENLSHGTRQRLAIASALLHEPKVFVIDEPMVGLDPIHARVVKEELKRQARNGATVLMSTHLLNIVEEVADRIGILHRGKLIFVGTLQELRAEEAKQGLNLEEIFLEMVG